MISVLASIIDAVAVAVLLAGLVIASVMGWRTYVAASGRPFERLSGPVLIRFRLTLGRWMLAGLEVLIVSDILHSIVHRSFTEIGILGLIVLIRSVMSYMLDLEIARIDKTEALTEGAAAEGKFS